MQPLTAAPPKAGRAYIGPKAQTHIWPDIYQGVREEAKERGIPLSDVWRELLEEAWAARGRGAA
jgi:hypothetical protein